jgi:signal transduction histidine kinase
MDPDDLGPLHPATDERIPSARTDGFVMLHEFIAANRQTIIDRARARVRERTSPKASEANVEHGVPLFLTQLVEALIPRGSPGAITSPSILDSADLHGADLLELGFTVSQVVHGYGDVCQVVTELAGEINAEISAEEFQIFNRCLDVAIAGAVTSFERHRDVAVARDASERLGALAHETRDLLHTAILSFEVIKRGTVGLGGSTGAVHERSLSRLQALVERSLAEVRLEAQKPTFERIRLADFIEETEVGASLQAKNLGQTFVAEPAAPTVMLRVDRHLLSSAVFNLLNNAFKFSHADGTVRLATSATESRVLIEVFDECGGLPPEKLSVMFRPFAQADGDRSGLGLGLTIAERAVHANAGDLRVRNVAGHGCVFSIDLPRCPAES